MYRYDGINQSGMTSATWSFPERFALGFALRTTTTQQGIVLGCSDAADRWFYVAINEGDTGAYKAGFVHVAMFETPGQVDIEFDASAMFDGRVHRLAIQRGGGDAIAIWLDDVLVVDEFDGSALGEFPIIVDRELCFGALNNDFSVEFRVPCDLGEFWYNAEAINPNAIEWIQKGLSPRSLSDGFSAYWPAFHNNAFLTGG